MATPTSAEAQSALPPQRGQPAVLSDEQNPVSSGRVSPPPDPKRRISTAGRHPRRPRSTTAGSSTIPKSTSLGALAVMGEEDEPEEQEEKKKSLANAILASAPHNMSELSFEILQFFLYIVFLICFLMVSIYSREPTASFMMNDHMKDLILNEEFPPEDTAIYKSFFDVGTTEEFWQYINGPFVGALFDPDSSSPPDKNDPGFIYGTNRVIGQVRLRQIRVKHYEDCKGNLPSEYSTFVGGCYLPYDPDDIDREPYGPDNRFVYSDSSETGMGSQQARLHTYEGGGYVVDLGQNLTENIATLRALQDDEWIDLQTRAVLIDFSVYNSNINLFGICLLSFEFMPVGGIYPGYQFKTANFLRYEGENGRVVMAFEIIIVVFLIAYTTEEVFEFVKGGWRAYVIKDYWNWMDNVTYITFYIAIAVRIVKEVVFAGMELPLDNEEVLYSNFYYFGYLAYLNSIENNTLGINAIFLFVKVIKYSTFSPRTQLIVGVMLLAFGDIIVFIVMLLIVLFGFGLCGFLLFGVDVEAFYDPFQAMLTLFRFTLGEFDLESVNYSNRVLGPLFFFFFAVMVVFIVLSMFLAIVQDSFGEVRKQTDHVQVDVIKDLKNKIKTKYNKLFNKQSKEDLEALANKLDDPTADQDGDGNLNREEFEKVVGKHGGLDFDLFDKDGDNQLDEEERRAMRETLQQAVEEAAAEEHDPVAEELAATINQRVDALKCKLDDQFDAIVRLLSNKT